MSLALSGIEDKKINVANFYLSVHSFRKSKLLKRTLRVRKVKHSSHRNFISDLDYSGATWDT